MRLTSLLFGALALCACVKEVPKPAAEPPDAGSSEAELVLPRLDAVEREVLGVLRANDEALWKTWTTGAPLELAANLKGHEALVSKDTVDLLRRARESRPDDGERIDALSRWIIGRMLVDGTATETEAITSLEASATFLVDGKEFAWRDLGKTLVSEKSALKRRQIWVGSHEVARKLDALIAARDQKVASLLASLGEPTPLEYAARSRGFELAKLERSAEDALASTDEAWKSTLQALSDVEVKLPASQLMRSDFPRLLKVPAAIDAEFPKAKIATRVVQTLGALGVYGQPGLTLDLAENTRKNPLPLTVVPTPGDVRVSIRPFGGLRDQQLALAEVGAALQLKKMATEPSYKGRLASPLAAQIEAEKFGALLSDRAWLGANEVQNADAIVKTVEAQRLFLLRRTAGVVLARLSTARAPDEAAARSTYVTVMSLAMGVTLGPDEGARWRVETDDFLRSATQLEAMLAASSSK